MRAEVSRLEAQLETQKAKTAGTTDDEKAEPVNSEDETDSDVSISSFDIFVYLER